MRHFFGILVPLVLGLLNFVQVASAQPAAPSKIVVPGGPGASADIVARFIATGLTNLGHPFIVENRPGGGTTIGTEYVAKSPPDGETLLLSTPSTVISAFVIPGLRYDPFGLVSVTVISQSALVLAANNDFPPRNVRELIAYAKANPGKVNFGSLGVATSHHITGEKFKIDAGIDMVHVPYRGGPAAAHADLIGGRIQIMFDNIIAMYPHIKAGKVRALAVTSINRNPMLPDVPTIAESGIPNFDAQAWFGLLAPPGTPADKIGRLNNEVVKVLQTAEVRDHLAKTGAQTVGNSPQAADQFLKAEFTRWGAIVKKANVRAE